jgi:HK97 family phage major capsid protein
MTARAQPLETFESHWDHFNAVRQYGLSGGASHDRRLLLQATPTGLNSAVPSEGGFLIPTEHAADIWEQATIVGGILRRVFKLPITKAGGIKIPRINEKSRANGSRAGAFAMAWLAEAGLFPTFDLGSFAAKMELKPTNLLGGICYVTDELASDSPAFNAWFPRKAGEELAANLEDAVIDGGGSGQPLGILKSRALIKVGPESGQAPQTVRTANVEKMAARLYTGSWQSPGTCWLCSTGVLTQLMTQSRGGAPLVEFRGNEKYMLGWPIVATESTPPLGTAGDLILCDLQQYILSERDSGVIGPIWLRFLQNESAIKVKTRCDGQPGWSTPITPKNDAVSQSAFVALGAR